MTNWDYKYYLHRRLKKAGVRVCSKSKVVYIPWSGDLNNKYAVKLRDKFNYVIQTEII